jgi:hypothetical protein
MPQKQFFRRRTEAQIRNMNPRKVYKARGLVEAIDSLDPQEDAIEIRLQLIPGRFYINVDTAREASRKALKHGEYGGWIKLPYPETEKDSLRSSEMPHQIRERAFTPLEKMKEEEINIFGYYERPNWGDRRAIAYPFIFIPKGVKIFAYAENQAGGVEIDTKYQNSNRVWRTGTDVPASVPSRTEKKSRYKFKLQHVPILKSPWNISTILRMRPATILDETGEPVKGRTEHETFMIRHPWIDSPQEDTVIWRYPHDAAAYITIAKHEWQENKNLTPMEMNPFALFGQRAARFYDKLENNLLVFDPSLSSKTKLRHPHDPEKSLLWARALGKFGYDDFGFWNPERDGALKTYWPTNIKE